MRYTYLLIDFFTVLVPLIFSFHPKLNFYKCWRTFFPATLISGALFIPWDIYFTHLKIWGFNPVYVSGYYIVNLPFEEVLFFLCVPYSCVFTFYCVTAMMKNNNRSTTGAAVTVVLIIMSVCLALKYADRSYTLFTFTGLAALLCAAQFLFRIKWLFKFYVVYAILLVPFLIVNGILTGTGLKHPIVWYNNGGIIGLRILTIPFEDIFYGMDLILLNILLFKFFNERFYNYLKSTRKRVTYRTNNIYANE